MYIYISKKLNLQSNIKDKRADKNKKKEKKKKGQEVRTYCNTVKWAMKASNKKKKKKTAVVSDAVASRVMVGAW